MDEDERVRARSAEDRPREEAATPVRTAKPQGKRWGLRLLGAFVGIPVLLAALWTIIALSWSYSEGTRTGYIQKFSQKGWVCKTWEGEIAMVNSPGAIQEKFPFTVRDDSVAKELQRVMGSRVALEYKQHRGVPGSCFGETGYYVSAVKALP